ncbi:EF-hand calcium-binding domain-containing protein 12 [Eudromia elegans]
MTSTDLIADLTDVKPEMVLGHCFKQQRLRNTYPHFFIKLKSSRFGPPRSRRRIIFAPPVAGAASSFPQPAPALDLHHAAVTQPPPEGEDSLCSPKITPSAEDDLQKLETWIMERKQFRSQLESLVDCPRLDSSQPWCWGRAPLIRMPYPQALITLQNLLHKHSFKMVDLFRKADVHAHTDPRHRSAMRSCELGERFCCHEVHQPSLEASRKPAGWEVCANATKVPISDKDLEDVIIFLTSSKQGNFIRSEDLVECQDRWLEMMQGQCREITTGVQAQSPKSTYRISTGSKVKEEKPLVPPKPAAQLRLLEVPPANTEPERRHVTYDEMEEIGKRFRDRKRREKSKDTLIEWREKCRLVRSGDRRVDEHCLPSTLAGDMAELTDHYRGDSFMAYLKSFNLCKEYKIHLTRLVLQKALLHPGDKIIKEGDDMRKIRQPGGPYTAAAARMLSPASASRSGASSKQAREMQNRQKSKVQRSGRMSRSDDNSFWPGHLLDKLRLFVPAPPGRAHAIFSYVHRTRPVCCGACGPESDRGSLLYGDAMFG